MNYFSYATEQAGNTLEPPRIDRITLNVMVDTDADTSFLEQEEFSELRESYHRGDYYFVGVRANADVSYAISNTDRRIETLTSGGVWGIESNSGKDYIEGEVGKDELNDLKTHLERFGVNTSNFDALIENVEVVWH